MTTTPVQASMTTTPVQASMTTTPVQVTELLHHHHAGEPERVTTQTPPTTSSLAQRFDCHHGLGDRGLEGWSATKRTWCCAHVDKGPESLSSRCNFEGISPPSRRGSSLQRHHDHDNEPRLTAAASVSAVAHYDCSEDYQNWKTGWSPTKKHYCCQEAGRACAEGSLPNKYPASTGSPTATSSSRLRTYGDDVSIKMAAAPWLRWKRWVGSSASSIAALTALALATGLSIALVLVGVSRWVKRRPKPTRSVSVLQRGDLEDLLRRSSDRSPEGKAAEFAEPGLE
jgi:hypothetical protein